MAKEILGYGMPDGVSVGNSGNLISLYGGNPVPRASGIAWNGLYSGVLTTAEFGVIETAITSIVDALGYTKGIGISAN